MMRALFIIFMGTLAAAGCQRSGDRNSDSRSSTTTPSTSAANPSTQSPENRAAENRAAENKTGANPSALNVPASAADERADNTGKNERDRGGSNPTAGDQGGSEADRRVTQQIRKAVVDDSKLSAVAKNVKIITSEGVVTLRGPVKTSQEKSQIAAIAQRVDGVKRVDNQLEIESK
jgi:hyperosmotically inducible protein